jgi:hypothetical protein
MREKARRGRAFRPGAEGFEDRALTTGGLGVGAAVAIAHHEHALAVAHHGGVTAEGRPARPHLAPPPIQPGLGRGLVRLALPLSYLDYGVITVWNNTFNPVTIGVSASTFANGQPFLFTIPSGTNRSFYAPVVNGQVPVFTLAVNPNFPPYVITQTNIVFESRAYVPAGTAGFPYSINFGVNGLYLSYI